METSKNLMASTARDFVGYGKELPNIQWPGNARLAISVVVNFEEGSERSPIRGDSIAEPSGEAESVPRGVANRTNESLFGYGSRCGIWRLLEILDKHHIKATFFSCAKALELNPVAARKIAVDGHEVCCHGLRWLPFDSLSIDEQRQHIHKAVNIIQRIVGVRPVGWFSWAPSEQMRALLLEEGGFIYDSNSFADDLPYFVDVSGKEWLVIPYDLSNNDGLFSRPPGYSTPADFYSQLKTEFDWLYEESSTSPRMMSIGLHLRFAGRPGRAQAVEKFIKYAIGFSDVWFARRVDIARWWLQSFNRDLSDRTQP